MIARRGIEQADGVAGMGADDAVDHQRVAVFVRVSEEIQPLLGLHDCQHAVRRAIEIDAGLDGRVARLRKARVYPHDRGILAGIDLPRRNREGDLELHFDLTLVTPRVVARVGKLVVRQAIHGRWSEIELSGFGERKLARVRAVGKDDISYPVLRLAVGAQQRLAGTGVDGLRISEYPVAARGVGRRYRIHCRGCAVRRVVEVDALQRKLPGRTRIVLRRHGRVEIDGDDVSRAIALIAINNAALGLVPDAVLDREFERVVITGLPRKRRAEPRFLPDLGDGDSPVPCGPVPGPRGRRGPVLSDWLRDVQQAIVVRSTVCRVGVAGRGGKCDRGSAGSSQHVLRCLRNDSAVLHWTLDPQVGWHRSNARPPHHLPPERPEKTLGSPTSGCR